MKYENPTQLPVQEVRQASIVGVDMLYSRRLGYPSPDLPPAN